MRPAPEAVGAHGEFFPRRDRSPSLALLSAGNGPI